MDEFVGVLILLGILVFAAGPIAVILALVLFNKLGQVERRLKQIEARGIASAPQSVKPKETTVERLTASQKARASQDVTVQPPVVTAKPIVPPVPPIPPAIEPKPGKTEAQQVEVPPVNIGKVEISQSQPADAEVHPPERPKQPPVTAVSQPPKPASKGIATLKAGFEEKIGITAALVVGVIVLIVGVGFFLKYVYENSLFSDLARVWLVAAGGAASLVVGEIIRRRDYGIVAKGLAALGFALLYASVFSAGRVYSLIDLTTALVLALCVSAGAMAYAVSLNDRFTAFLSLLGGYLSPLVIMYDKILPMPVFSYLLALSIGAMASAMFRRWRAVNWIAFVGTYLLYTVWFEQFYAPSYMRQSLMWVGIFGAMYLVQPILFGLVRKVNARAEDVTLVVANSIAVFYYFSRILYATHQQQLALAIGAFGIIHLGLMAAVLVRCRDDKKLSTALGVLGTALITTAIGVYFAEMPPKILGWAVEAVVLTFIGLRYKSYAARIMGFLVAGVSIIGLLYHLPLHDGQPFRLLANGPFATWLFVSAALLVCYVLWRRMAGVVDAEREFGSQVYYVIGVLLLASGCALEWYAYCDLTFLKQAVSDSRFLMGMTLISSALLAVLSTRPLRPGGAGVKTIAAMTAVGGAIFTGLTVLGVYTEPFLLFVNVPFVVACVFVVSFFWSVRQLSSRSEPNPFQSELVDSLVVVGLILIAVLISEQLYMFWYCRHEYAGPVAGWRANAWRYMTIGWAVYGVAMLYAGIRFKKAPIKGLAACMAVLSVAGLCAGLPLHKSGDFKFVFNLPFITWICSATGLLIGHGLWRFMPQAQKQERENFSQVYYIFGVLLAGIGCVVEWYARCRWQISDTHTGQVHFLLGVVIMLATVQLVCFIRSLAPAGWGVRVVGLAVGLFGAGYAFYVMGQVYDEAFTLFANGPFMILLLYVAAMLASAAFTRDVKLGKWSLALPMVLAGLILLWGILSQQIYQYFYWRYESDAVIENWRFSAQMYISLSWAIYAALLLLIGFFKRAAGVRYLSLTIFTVLLGKINWDIHELPTEYRIATFVTTGLILVGVSFLYQFLKKKGFFDTIQDKKIEQLKNNPVNPVNPV